MNKRVLVTGGSSGIGHAIITRLAQDGFDCINLDLSPPPQCQGLWVKADLSTPETTGKALSQALAGGPITRLVNNVGIVRPAAVEDATIADLEAVVSMNLRCALQCLQSVLPGMKEQCLGRVVNITSRVALGKELRSVYAATKSGLHGMTKTWALELGRYGITANAVAPGPIRTALFEAANPPEDPRTKAIVEAIPVRRMGVPEDVAHAVAMLLDHRAGFVTGQTLYVCGGMTVGLAS
ncbi:SDR family oxidoreductase [Mesorhizobium sp. B4-1-4]|uniref:SDR family oxidoreductase n=1 Tax=Mesorhizobium sp. B4-1-4 TaxID=2589888 RepID=UPI0011290202|nr:SDR family oxidoreductase [Mesorhizobium sp. B4-1-4]UCI31792.1 SDR family oxidoreductase [Mesorhizobium sp. B4-1-4]